MDRFSVIY